MKKLLKWICHPALCWRYTMDKERFLLFCTACIYKEIEDPTVWEVDKLTEVLDLFLVMIHMEPDIFDNMPVVKKGLFLTRILSRFKQLKFNREDTRKFIEMYGEFKGLLDGKLPKVGSVEVFQAWQIVGDNFIFG